MRAKRGGNQLINICRRARRKRRASRNAAKINGRMQQFRPRGAQPRIDATFAACQKRAISPPHKLPVRRARRSSCVRGCPHARIHQSPIHSFTHSLARSFIQSQRPAKQCDTKDVRRPLKGVPPIAQSDTNAWLKMTEWNALDYVN